MKLSPACILFLLACPLAPACNRVQSLSFVPMLPGYAEAPAHSLYLKKALREISGIHYYSASELAAINDEKGIIYFVDNQTGEFRQQPFGEKGDYEDIAKTPTNIYVLKSNGQLHEVSAAGGKESAVYTPEFGKSIEFESLCYDAATDQLLLICKSCADEPVINAWRFDCKTKVFLPGPVFTLPWTDIRKMAKDDTRSCLPSAAAIHPITGELYIIASLGKMLLICSKEGKLKSLHKINPYQFQQPEGLCFTPDGGLYVSNEGRKSRATILYYPYTKK